MDKLQALLLKLRERKRIFTTTMIGPEWPAVVQRLGESALDCLILDIEHGALGVESSEPMLRTARLVDLPTIVRVPDVVPDYISKIIDMGADGVMLPRVESEAQVALAIRSMRFSPRGRKGCGGFSLFRKGESFDEINDNRMIWIQIESREGVDALPGILSRFGDEIACVVIGPYDMSIMIGKPLEIKCEAMLSNVSEVFTICRENNKSCGIFVDGALDLDLWNSLGANIFWVGTELSLLMSAIADIHERILSLEDYSLNDK